MTEWQSWEQREQQRSVPPQFAGNAQGQRATHHAPQYVQSQQYQQYQQYQQSRHQAARGSRHQGAARFTGIQGVGLFAAGVAVSAVAAGAFYLVHGSSGSSPVTAAAAAAQSEPETEAGVRTAAGAYYDLYSASQWDQAYVYLAPSVQKAIPVATWTAEHDGCPSASAGLARQIEGVTMAGSTAVVKETIAGALSKLGTGSDSWAYTGSRWGLIFSPSDLALYSHGSVKADVAAAKKAGYCAN